MLQWLPLYKEKLYKRLSKSQKHVKIEELYSECPQCAECLAVY